MLYCFQKHMIKYVKNIKIFYFCYSKVTRIYMEHHIKDKTQNDR